MQAIFEALDPLVEGHVFAQLRPGGFSGAGKVADMQATIQVGAAQKGHAMVDTGGFFKGNTRSVAASLPGAAKITDHGFGAASFVFDTGR